MPSDSNANVIQWPVVPRQAPQPKLAGEPFPEEAVPFKLLADDIAIMALLMRRIEIVHGTEVLAAAIEQAMMGHGLDAPRHGSTRDEPV